MFSSHICIYCYIFNDNLASLGNCFYISGKILKFGVFLNHFVLFCKSIKRQTSRCLYHDDIHIWLILYFIFLYYAIICFKPISCVLIYNMLLFHVGRGHLTENSSTSDPLPPRVYVQTSRKPKHGSTCRHGYTLVAIGYNPLLNACENTNLIYQKIGYWANSNCTSFFNFH